MIDKDGTREANKNLLEMMFDLGTENNSELQIEFFFYADTEDNASNLAIDLHKLSYEVYGIDKSPGDKKWNISGITPKMKMDEETLNEWSERMIELAETNDCIYDGWGTLIDQ